MTSFCGFFSPLLALLSSTPQYACDNLDASETVKAREDVSFGTPPNSLIGVKGPYLSSFAGIG